MSTDRDTTRIVRSWLRSDEHESADRVLDAVLDQIDTTPQRRATGWPARRLPVMNTFAKLGTVAATVLLAVVGYIYLSGGPGIGGPLEATPSPTPTPEPTVLTPSNAGQNLAPGAYRVESTFARPFTFAIETEWILEFLGTDVVSLNRAEDPGADWLDIQVIGNVYANPCAGQLSDPPVAKTPDDLIRALAEMADFEAGPITDVSIGEHDGSHVVVTNQMDGDADGCVAGNSIPIYTTVDYPDPSITNGNSRDELWVVDVDGTPIVLHGLITRSSNEAADIAETQEIVETIAFD